MINASCEPQCVLKDACQSFGGGMDTLPYQLVFERIRAEYLEMPGMRLTPAQVQRLSGVSAESCSMISFARSSSTFGSTEPTRGELTVPLEREWRQP
jgi:hypothetical protein